MQPRVCRVVQHYHRYIEKQHLDDGIVKTAFEAVESHKERLFYMQKRKPACCL